MVETTVRPSQGRGCGDRKEGEPYVCCGAGGDTPIEHFIIDPAKFWPTGWQRGTKIIQRGKMPVNDLVIFIGKEFYPSAWDYVEEVHWFGASRRVPQNLPFEKLTPVVSRMVFVHARAIPDFGYHLNRTVPLPGCKVWRWEDEDIWKEQDVLPGWHPLFETAEIANGDADAAREPTPCTFGLRDLAFLQHWKEIETDRGSFIVKMPSFNYRGKYPNWAEENFAAVGFNPDRLAWKIGIFMALPLTHIEFSKKSDPEIEKKVREAGFECEVLDW